MAVMLAGAVGAQDRGEVTNLPIPRFVSLKAAEQRWWIRVLWSK